MTTADRGDRKMQKVLVTPRGESLKTGINGVEVCAPSAHNPCPPQNLFGFGGIWIFPTPFHADLSLACELIQQSGRTSCGPREIPGMWWPTRAGRWWRQAGGDGRPESRQISISWQRIIAGRNGCWRDENCSDAARLFLVRFRPLEPVLNFCRTNSSA